MDFFSSTAFLRTVLALGGLSLLLALEWQLVVTPPMHWIHHSRRPREHNANFGTMLSIWDRLFGTYIIGIPQEKIPLGLDDYPSPEHVGLLL